MQAMTEQSNETRFHFWIKVLVGVNSAFRIIAAIVLWFLLKDVFHWSNPAFVFQLVLMVSPILILLALLHSSWKEKICDLKCVLVLATIATVGSGLSCIYGFVLGGSGLIDGVLHLINAPLVGSLAYVIYRRIQEIKQKVNAYPMGDTQTAGSPV